MEYIIVQAGGKGTRLGHLTRNKPKALVPVENLPMLFHLFRKYPDKRFVIIADYKREVLREYLAAFADVRYQVVDAQGTGTCAGIRQALALIPEGQPFLLVWSDLILPEGFRLPQGYGDSGAGCDSPGRRPFCMAPSGGAESGAGGTHGQGQGVPGEIPGEEGAESGEGRPQDDYIGISTTFPCRWSYADGAFREEPSCEDGVAGFFLFADKGRLQGVPDSGELVRWMQSEGMRFQRVSLAGTREFGLLEEYQQLERVRCRPFNRITIEGDVVVKEALDAQGEALAKREWAWYEKAASLAACQATEGRATAAQAVALQPRTGQSVEEQATAAQAVALQTRAGQSTEEHAAAARAVAVQTRAGQSAEEHATVAQAVAMQTRAGQSVEQTTAAQAAEEHAAAAQTRAEQSVKEQATAAQAVEEHAAALQTRTGQSVEEHATAAQAVAAQTRAGQSMAVQATAGQAWAGAPGRSAQPGVAACHGRAPGNLQPILPAIYGREPLRMEHIRGRSLYECALDRKGKRAVLERLVGALDRIHALGKASADPFSMKEAYFRKTMDRLSRIEDLVPFARDREVLVNGKRCRNVLFHKRELEERLERLDCGEFVFIHGDCTFSNLLLREDGTPVLIDPRGYFGHTEFYGDVRYDWAKLYYSIVGNYDRFNLKEFSLDITGQGAELEIASSHWEDMEGDFFELTGADEREIRLLHAVIWLSLTTYAWHDYDSVCGAFYNGLYHLEDVL